MNPATITPRIAGATILQFPRGQRRSLATLDRAWRAACCDYLFACFNHAPATRLQELAGRIYFARKALERRRAPRDETRTGPPP